MNFIDLTTEHPPLSKEVFVVPKHLLRAFQPLTDDKQNMKFFTKTIFGIVQTIEGIDTPLTRKHVAEFARRCVPEVLTEILNIQALVTVLYKCIRDKFLPCKDLLFSCTNKEVKTVDGELFNCFTHESVQFGYRCNGNGNLVFTIEEALQWFLTRGLLSPDGTIVTSLEKVKRKGADIHFPPLSLQLYTCIHPEFDEGLRADLFFCKHTYDLERCLDYRYELFQDWEHAEGDTVNRQAIIDELQVFSDEWTLDIPSLHMMKSIMANPPVQHVSDAEESQGYENYVAGMPVEGFTVEQIFEAQQSVNQN